MSIRKITAKEATTENMKYGLFWQITVEKNRLRVSETGTENLQKDFSLYAYASDWFCLFVCLSPFIFSVF